MSICAAARRGEGEGWNCVSSLAALDTGTLGCILAFAFKQKTANTSHLSLGTAISPGWERGAGSRVPQTGTSPTCSPGCMGKQLSQSVHWGELARGWCLSVCLSALGVMAGPAQVLRLNVAGLLRLSPNHSKFSVGLGRLEPRKGVSGAAAPVLVRLQVGYSAITALQRGEVPSASCQSLPAAACARKVSDTKNEFET